jgi:transcriptional regulator with GAF, ATPase, and Fis domain/Tfp pilus assembly protein PilF
MSELVPRDLGSEVLSGLDAVDAALKRRDFERAARLLDGWPDPGGRPPSEQGVYWSRRAKIAFETRAYADARQCARRAIDLLGSTMDHEALAYAQLVYGYTLTATGDMHDAELAVRDAISSLRRAGLDSDLSEPYNALAQVYFLRSDYDRACEYLNESRRLALQAHRDDDARRVLGNLGRVLILAGRWEEAEVALREALAAQEKLGRAIGIVRNLLSLGYLFVLQHRTGEVRPLWQRAEKLIEEHSLVLERVILLEYEGDLAHAEERYNLAIEKLTEAVRRGDELAPASSIHNQVYRRLADAACGKHDFEQALEWARQSIELSRKLGDRQEEGSALRVEALALAGMGQDFTGTFDRSLSVLRAVGDPYELAKAYLAYGTSLAHGGTTRSAEALRLLDRARELAGDLGSEKIEADIAMAQAQARAALGQLDAALAYLGPAEQVLGERARRYRHELEKRLVAEAVSTQNEFLVFKSFVGEGDPRSGNIEADLVNLARKLDADSACVLLNVDDVPACAAHFGPAQFDVPALAAVFAPLFAAGKEAEPYLYTDLVAHPEFARRLAAAGRAASSVVVVPLHFAEEVIGVVYLERCIPDRPFGRSALNLAVAMAEPLGFRAAEIRARKMVTTNKRLKEQLGAAPPFPGIITRNQEMLAMLAQVAQVKDAPITIALEGETGVGKDLLAKAIHYQSDRREKRFVSVNCAALPETLLESELFGHMKGAYTGADRDKAGLLEEAHGGTFFLDEIGEMPLSIQAKLLRVLEEKEVVRLGDTKPRKVDIRIIIASNRDLKAEMEQGQFRQDLFYRLCTLSFRIPPLRERREDIPLLLDHFLAKYSPPLDDSDPVTVDPVAFQWLVEYDWPGNVRELENEIKKLVLLSGPGRRITPDILSSKFFRPDGGNGGGEQAVGDTRSFSLYDFLGLYEKKYIQQALAEHNWVKKHAAAALNIPESTLRLKMKQYGLKPKGRPGDGD